MKRLVSLAAISLACTAQPLARGQESTLREKIRAALFVPARLPPLDARVHGRFRPAPGVVAERITYHTLLGQRVTAVLYRPAARQGKAPALIVVNGHGGDKYSWYAWWAGIACARGGAVVLTYDPIGEGERSIERKRTESGLQTSIGHFEQAIAADPEYGAAHAGLADAYALLASYGVVAPREVMPKARSAARRALALDDSHAEAHTSLGFILSFYDWDWDGAEREYQRAIELDPGYPTARQWYSGYLRAVGRLGESLSQMKQAQDLDPLSLAGGRDMGRIYASMRKFDQAIEQYRRVLELDPNLPSAYLHLGMAYEGKRMHEEAVAAFEKARSLPGGNPLALGALGYGYALSGNRRDAEKLVDELGALSTRRYVSPMSRAFIYIGLGDKSRSFEWLERARQDHDPWMTWLNAEPVFDPLRDDPRFGILLKTIGLRR
ncbi:MAG: tetratricopeptide repeat protein [Acidobacteria bacterium]|nr:tetratricopeptide repeat protein [Acidobacteriota bacterium]